MQFECVCDGVVPDEAKSALNEGKAFFCKTSIGWIQVDIDSVEEFRNSVTYKFEEEE